ncbi:hypothetical protein E8L99_09545 [Phreatobacter aquaticus]|uniref:Uncharacterized protein n=1 Tax=Phreatobacter aquaticus TaxID=2570229 RepID=A0A4D7QJA5_9HYPH|nr:hypothetical protein [Phreatobacter aquaticus]QCK85983.1 hypothetical protein E8L99_09545 [Phreatobacter aquaticus]
MFRPISRDWHASKEAFRELRGRRVAYAALAASLAYAVYAFVLFPTTVARVRLGLDLTVGGVTRSASNIVELRSRAGFGLAGLAGPTRPVLRGEAVPLALGRHAILVLLLSPVDPTTPADWPLRQIVAAAGGDPHAPLDNAIAWLGRQSGRFDLMRSTAEYGGESRPLHPDMIFLPDRRVPLVGAVGARDWRPVDAEAPDSVLGTDCARITVWIEPVSRFRPISRGDLAISLPWFNRYWLKHWGPEPPADGLNPASLKVD